MKTSVIGYPRIGASRELKFTLEQYFKGQINIQEVQQTAAAIRWANWSVQQANGIDFIPSNDFSLYDGVLDTAAFFNIIPQRYRDLKLGKLDTYFAMARGYQGDQGDVKALAMKKWFNTNYHYMVPEIEEGTQIRVAGSKLFDEYIEAKAQGVETKPVLTGAYTLLKLAKYSSGQCLEHYIDDAAAAYGDVITQLEQLGAEWIQFDEPYLVTDLTAEDLRLLNKLYTKIAASKTRLKILIQTYFGDVRDCYEMLQALPIDGIGLDFVEGKQSLELLKKHGFAANQTLFAGLVNGRNIWRNHYEHTLRLLQQINEHAQHVVLSTSCSLLHVPYTVKQERKLDEAITRYFAFAEEKLQELSQLKHMTTGLDAAHNELYKQNKELHSTARFTQNEALAQQLAALNEQDFTRLPAFNERQGIQKAKLNLPKLPTTTIGSFPQTSEVRVNRAAFKKGSITAEQYKRFNFQKIAECVKQQEQIGLDVLVHGEFERNDMVEYFGECLDGFVFTELAWVQSYGTRCVKPPIIWGDISRSKPITVTYSVYANSLSDKPVKGMLTGPVTILNWSFPREDISLRDIACQIGLAIRDEVLDLEANHIHIIQIDEAALREKLPLRQSDWFDDYLSWAIPAFRLVHSKVQPETQIHTHMCYSQFSDIIKEIDAMDADVISFEASRSDLSIIDTLQECDFQTVVGPGVYDIHSPRIPSVDELVEAIKRINQKVDTDKLWINPDCGLKTRGELETWASLKNLVEAAQIVRNQM